MAFLLPKKILKNLKIDRDKTMVKQNDMEVYIDNLKSQMRKGILEYCILMILHKNEFYSTSIINKLKEMKMIVVEGTIYPLLTRLKNQGILDYRWEESPFGPPRKYYSLTDKGKEILAELDKEWKTLMKAVEEID